MIIIMQAQATESQVDQVVSRIESLNLSAQVSQGDERVLVGVKGDCHGVLTAPLERMPGVDEVIRILKPYKMASRTFHPENSVVEAGAAVFGGRDVVVAAGPCSVEGEVAYRQVAQAVHAAGARCLRGGAFKPRSSPYSFQGLGEEGLRILRAVGDETGLPVQTEATNPRALELVVQYADIVQIGARNMQNYDLLKEAGQAGKPVLLKRGMAASIEDLLCSAEYIMDAGNEHVLLCERGIRTFETATRNTLDLSAVPVLKEKSHLPVVVDPSHAAGHARYVTSLAMGAVAAGCDGLLVEVHDHPDQAFSDGEQSLLPADFQSLMGQVRAVAEAIGRSVS